ncbi:MAG: hypothetical protein RRC07_15055 [Anaerolineae bacterium]|nr:hypothetical protein [Anaerolineae bacterium]
MMLPLARLSRTLVYLILPLLALLLLLAPAAAAPEALAPAYFTAKTIIETEIVAANSFGVLRVHCPAGMVALSGGVDVENVITMGVSSSAPAYGPASSDRLLSQDDGPAPAPTAWQATVINDAAAAQDYRVGVLCVDAAAGLSSVIGSASVSPGSFYFERVLCPAGTISTGGGIDVAQVLQMRVSSSAPVFPGVSGNRLIQQSDGITVPPNGWQGTAINDDVAIRAIKVAAICAPETAGALTAITSRVLTGSFGSARAVCPANMIAAGGGVDVDNVLTMDISASAMTFTGAAARLYQQDDGTQGPPYGWQGTARGPAGETVRTGAICLPLYHSFIPTTMRE